MSDEKLSSGFPVDEHGEIFQADLTDEDMPSPRERAAHGTSLAGENVDSQEGDEFMRKQYGSQKKAGT